MKPPRFAPMRSLAAAVLTSALTDLLKGRDTAEILSWVQVARQRCRSGWRAHVPPPKTKRGLIF